MGILIFIENDNCFDDSEIKWLFFFCFFFVLRNAWVLLLVRFEGYFREDGLLFFDVAQGIFVKYLVFEN